MNEDVTSLAHTKWRCQYHLVFAPKYRRQIIYGKYKVEIGKTLQISMKEYIDPFTGEPVKGSK